jgi:hypothetical protein
MRSADWKGATVASLTLVAAAVVLFWPGHLGDSGPISRVAIVIWLAVIGYSMYCRLRLREYRRPDAPAWKFSMRPQGAEPELYTAEGQQWLQRGGTAEAAMIIGFWVVVVLSMIGL